MTIESFMSQYGSIVISGCVAVFSALCAAISWKLNNLRIKEVKKELDQARARGIYTKCPKCGAKVNLEDLTFYDPAGFKDDDLDGVPDVD